LVVAAVRLASASGATPASVTDHHCRKSSPLLVRVYVSVLGMDEPEPEQPQARRSFRFAR